MDSTLRDFGEFFNQQYPYFQPEMFDYLDTAMTSEFFHEDFFEKQFFEQNQYLLKMMQEMDSVKNLFFKEGYLLNNDDKPWWIMVSFWFIMFSRVEKRKRDPEMEHAFLFLLWWNKEAV